MLPSTRSMEDLKTLMSEAQAALDKAKANFNEASVDVLLKTVADVFSEHPEIEQLGWKFYYEYDDEGSYSWYPEGRVLPGGLDLGSATVSYTGYSGKLATYEQCVVDDISERIGNFDTDVIVALVARLKGSCDIDEGVEHFISREDLSATATS